MTMKKRNDDNDKLDAWKGTHERQTEANRTY